jgi:hypothetical protein
MIGPHGSTIPLRSGQFVPCQPSTWPKGPTSWSPEFDKDTCTATGEEPLIRFSRSLGARRRYCLRSN